MLVLHRCCCGYSRCTRTHARTPIPNYNNKQQSARVCVERNRAKIDEGYEPCGCVCLFCFRVACEAYNGCHHRNHHQPESSTTANATHRTQSMAHARRSTIACMWVWSLDASTTTTLSFALPSSSFASPVRTGMCVPLRMSVCVSVSVAALRIYFAVAVVYDLNWIFY